jgi:hypothetical protein
VKPVLFAHLDTVTVEGFALPRPTWIRGEHLRVAETVTRYRTSAREGTPAVVVDLPGIEGIAVGLALADFGFRPVPLYTALPAPEAIVPMFDLVRALIAGAEELGRKALPRAAPPAFLLDARRDGRGRQGKPGQFDNRSLAFPTDFPSANRLRDGGIGAVVLIQAGSNDVREDIAQTLAAWAKGGLPQFLLRADAPQLPAPIAVRAHGLLRRFALWLRRASLRRDASGGFGGRIPQGG